MSRADANYAAAAMELSLIFVPPANLAASPLRAQQYEASGHGLPDWDSGARLTLLMGQGFDRAADGVARRLATFAQLTPQRQRVASLRWTPRTWSAYPLLRTELVELAGVVLATPLAQERQITTYAGIESMLAGARATMGSALRVESQHAVDDVVNAYASLRWERIRFEAKARSTPVEEEAAAARQALWRKA